MGEKVISHVQALFVLEQCCPHCSRGLLVLRGRADTAARLAIPQGWLIPLCSQVDGKRNKMVSRRDMEGASFLHW